MAFPLYSMVEVIQLITPERHVTGNEGLVRQPRVGDMAFEDYYKLGLSYEQLKEDGLALRRRKPER